MVSSNFCSCWHHVYSERDEWGVIQQSFFCSYWHYIYTVRDEVGVVSSSFYSCWVRSYILHTVSDKVGVVSSSLSSCWHNVYSERDEWGVIRQSLCSCWYHYIIYTVRDEVTVVSSSLLCPQLAKNHPTTTKASRTACIPLCSNQLRYPDHATYPIAGLCALLLKCNSSAALRQILIATNPLLRQGGFANSRCLVDPSKKYGDR